MTRIVILLSFAALAMLAEPAAAQPFPGGPPPIGFLPGFSPLVPAVDPFPTVVRSRPAPFVVRSRYRVAPPVVVGSSPVFVGAPPVVVTPAPVFVSPAPVFVSPAPVVVPGRVFPLRPARRAVWAW